MLMRVFDHNLEPAFPTPAEMAEERRLEQCEMLLDKVANGQPVNGVTVDDVVDALGYESIASLVALVLRGGSDFNFRLGCFRRNAIEKSLPLFSEAL